MTDTNGSTDRHGRRAETKAVKDALKKAGFEVKRVGHGVGTAWGWLDVALNEPYTFARDREAVKVIQLATGRRSPEEYDGNISISMEHAIKAEPTRNPAAPDAFVAQDLAPRRICKHCGQIDSDHEAAAR